MKKPSKIEYFKDKNLAEIYQKSGLQFAFLSKPSEGSRQCHEYVKCRDFLGDAVFATLQNKGKSIYDFSFDPNLNPPIDLTRIRMLVRESNKANFEKLDKTMSKCIALLNYYEAKMSRVKSTCVKTKEGEYIISGPGTWLQSPALVSLYTLLIRVSEHNAAKEAYELDEDLKPMYISIIEEAKKSGYDYPEISQLNTVYENILSVVRFKDKIFGVSPENRFSAVYYASDNISTIHNKSGIVALLSKNSNYISKTVETNFKNVEESEHLYKKFKVLKFNQSFPIYNSYKKDSFNMAWANKDGKVITNFDSCREVIVSNIRSMIPGTKIKHNTKLPGIPKVDMNNLKLVIQVLGVDLNPNLFVEQKEALFFAKKVLNTIEKKYKFKKSSITSVIVDGYNRMSYAWQIKLGQDWMHNPVLLSHALSVLRNAKAYYLANKKEVAEESVTLTLIKNMWKHMYEHESFIRTTDKIVYVKSKQIDMILKNYTTLFNKDNLFDRFYCSDCWSNLSFFSKLGIASLIGGNHCDDNLQKKANELK